MASFRLPLPPSANDLVRPTVMYLGNDRRVAAQVQALIRSGELTARLVATKEAKAFREAAHYRLPVAPIPGPVELYLTAYMPSIASDLANREKALSDALNGRLFFDDRQIAENHSVKRIADDTSKPFVVVEVVPADTREHAELARRLAKSSIQERANERAQSSLFTPTPNFKANR